MAKMMKGMDSMHPAKAGFHKLSDMDADDKSARGPSGGKAMKKQIQKAESSPKMSKGKVKAEKDY